MIGQLLRHEFTLLRRDRRLFLLVLVSGGLLLASGWVGHLRTAGQEEARTAAVANSRAQWEGLGDYNPHSAAHFGTYAFKPVGGLAALDPGIDPFLGNVLRLEGHVQNEPGFSQASLSGSLVRFGSLQPALILQVLLPLLLVFATFSSVVEDRESGRLRLLLVQGADPVRLLLAKGLAWWIAAMAIVVLTLLVFAGLGAATGNAPEGARVLLFGASYAVWFGVVVFGSVLVSAVARDGRGALVALLLVWLAWTVILPRAAGQAADSLHPLPTRVAFELAKDEDRAQGLDGHNPADERRVALEERVLAEYGVERVEDLPINFDGIALQADEEYGNQVWDRHFGAVRETLDRQQGIVRAASWVDPFLAIRSLSATIAETDLSTSLAFQAQAERYRRDLIEELNNEHAYGGSTFEDWSWTADADFYRGIEDFTYTPPVLAGAMTGAMPDIVVLLFWLLAVVGLTPVVGRRLRAV